MKLSPEATWAVCFVAFSSAIAVAVWLTRSGVPLWTFILWSEVAPTWRNSKTPKVDSDEPEK